MPFRTRRSVWVAPAGVKLARDVVLVLAALALCPLVALAAPDERLRWSAPA